MKKVVVITGASSGIGKTTAEYLYNKGYAIYGLSRNAGSSEGINYIQCDVTIKESIDLAFKQIYENEQHIDFIINNAGIGVSGAIEYSSEEELEKIFSVNVYGVINVCQVGIKYLRETKGKIINIGSVAGPITIPFQAYYSMTKTAVQSLSEALRMELKPFGIKVSTVLPGDTKTNFTKNRYAPKVNENEFYKNRIINSLKRMEKDEENGVSPLKVTKAIYKVMKRKNPPMRIVVGFDYKLLVFLKRLLPDKLVNYIVYKLYAK